MTEKTGYAVLRFVAQNHYCHLVHDYVQGYSIMEYAKENIILEKKKVFLLVKELAFQMEQFYKCEEGAYGHLNPYAVIVTEEEHISLLDVWAEENKELLMKMQKKKVRSLFISPEYVLSQRKRKEDDWYGFGKTVMFFVEKCCGKNVFTYRETRILQKLYTKCASGEKADGTKWKTLQKMMEKLLVEKKEKRRLFPQIGMAAVVLGGFAGGVFIGKAQIPQKELVEEVVEEEGMQLETELEESAEAYMEIGLEYLLLDEESESGLRWLHLAGEQLPFAEEYRILYQYLQKDVLDEEEKEQLQTFLKELQAEAEPYQKYCYQLPLLKAYAKLENTFAWEALVSLTNTMEKTEEVRFYLAEAYEKLGKYEAAIVEYEELKQMCWNAEEVRNVFERLIILYDAVDLPQKAEENYEEAIMLIPNLVTDEAFVKLKEQYGIGKEEQIVTEESKIQE